MLADAHGLRAEARFDEGYPVLVNDRAMASEALDVARDVLGPGDVYEMPQPVMASEDFAYVLQRVPGAPARDALRRHVEGVKAGRRDRSARTRWRR